MGTVDIQIRWEERKKEEGMARDVFSLDVTHHVMYAQGCSRWVAWVTLQHFGPVGVIRGGSSLIQK